MFFEILNQNCPNLLKTYKKVKLFAKNQIMKMKKMIKIIKKKKKTLESFKLSNNIE